MTIWNLIVAAGLIALGIATCINNANEDFRNVMIMIAGIFVIVDASLRILTQVIQVFRFEHGAIVKTDLAAAVTGASELAIGILLVIISRNNVEQIRIVLSYLIYFISILLMTIGGVAMIYAILFLVKKAGNTARNILNLIAGAIVVTAGVLILVFSTTDGMLSFIFVMFGIAFILAGIGVLLVAIALAVVARRNAKVLEETGEEPAHEDTVVAEAEPVKEEPEAEEKEAPAEKPSEDEKAE